jgi:hypothetical protein
MESLEMLLVGSFPQHKIKVETELDKINGKLNLNQEEMEKLFWELPEDMRMDAHKWGMNDTP